MFLFFCLRSSIFPAEEQKRTFFASGSCSSKSSIARSTVSCRRQAAFQYTTNGAACSSSSGPTVKVRKTRICPPPNSLSYSCRDSGLESTPVRLQYFLHTRSGVDALIHIGIRVIYFSKRTFLHL